VLTTVTVRQSQAFRRSSGRVSIGLWTKELGPIAFEIDQQQSARFAVS
jgi:hypothetical protein